MNTNHSTNKRQKNQNNLRKSSIRRRIQAYWADSRWTIIGLAWLVTLAMGTLGFQQYFSIHPPKPDEQPTFTTLIYLSFQLFTLESGAPRGTVPFSLELARWFSPFLAAYTAIAAMTLIFAEQFQMLWLRVTRNHVIICGLGRRGYLLAESFSQQGHRVVVIEKDKENDLLDACRDAGITALIGDAANQEILAKAGVSRAQYLVAVNGEDALNAEIALRAKEARRIRNGHKQSDNRDRLPLTCLVHITEPKLCDMLHEHETSEDGSEDFRLEFFSVFDMGAKAILLQYPPFPTQITPASPSPHILLVGLGSMGRSLVVRAARQWRDHLRQAQVKGKLTPGFTLPLTISVVDRHAFDKVGVLELRFPRLSAICQVRTYQMDIESPEFQKGDFLWKEDGKTGPDVVYVCLDNVALSLATGLTLHQHLRGRNIPIVIRTTDESSISGLLQNSAKINRDEMENVRELNAFGLLERTCRPELVLGGMHEVLARALHEEYILSPVNQGTSSKENPFLVPWEFLSEQRKEKNRRQADRLVLTLRENGYGIQPFVDWDVEPAPFHEDEIEKMAQSEHRLWLAEMQKNGWKLGPRSERMKTNPNLVPWDQLPPDVKNQNRDPYLNVQTMLAGAGLQVNRLT